MVAMRGSTYTVTYDSESHWRVITQMAGSSWPKVLPYCLFNVFLMILATWVEGHNTQSWRLKISSQGHSFITLVVSFLLVSRVNTCLTRYNEARGYIGLMYQHVREVVQDSCVFSRGSSANPTTETPTAPQQWRHDVAYQAIVLLRTAMIVIDYPADKLLPWNIPELNGAERDIILNDGFLNPANLRYSHTAVPPAHRHDDWEEAMRVPIRLSYALRKTIQTQSTILVPAIAVVQENRLHASVDAIMNGYYGLLKFLTTPVPFPLIQMTRTFLFLYVFTVPFVLLNDASSLFAHCFIVFLLTYGFVGLEVVSIELDNPFGNDANDFNNSAMAVETYEDCYLTILDVDGPDWTNKLHARMQPSSSTTPGMSSEGTPLL